MRRRRDARAPAILTLLALLAALAGGCGHGDTIPVTSPGRTGDWPVDPAWQRQSPLVDNPQFTDVAWRPATDRADVRAVAVGLAGLALHFDGRRWMSDLHAGGADLRAVAVDADGTFWAVGDGGVVLRCRDGAWARDDAGHDADLAVVGEHLGRLWVAGADGAIWERRDTDWRDVSLPFAGSVDALVARADTLFAAVDDQIWQRHGDAWLGPLDVPWNLADVTGLAVGPDDRLYALADSLYRRDPAGWRGVGGLSFGRGGGNNRIFAHGDELWVLYWSSLLTWNVVTAPDAFSNPATWAGDAVTVGPDGSALATTVDGQLRWYAADGRREYDPAGMYRAWRLVRLDEGPDLLNDYYGLRRGDAADLPLAFPAPGGPDPAYVLSVGAYGGRHCDDVYAATGRELWHWRQGAWQLEGQWAENLNPRSLAVDHAGRVVVGAREGLLRWDGTAWQQLLPGWGTTPSPGNFTVRRGALGDLLATTSNGHVYREHDGEWTLLREFSSMRAAVQTADGEILVVARAPNGTYAGQVVVCVTRPGSGRWRDYEGDAVGPLQGLDPAGATDRDGEILVWTAWPGRVLRLVDHGSVLDWELVAGPLDMQIGALERQPDGTLLAVSGSDDYVVRHLGR